jgi:serine/threonine-protein kinase
MATVYLGRDEVLDRPVAVKILKSGFDGDIAERFQREGRTVARLSHPNLVQVYDAGEGELDGRAAPYIVMEHVPGGDLKSAIATEGPMSSEKVAWLGSGVSAGLDHAHERGVIHRDIKPHNILLDGAGSPKLTDFGIARALDATTMTVSGVYLGTALYSSPEQLKGEEVTPKSDVYSLGTALYQAVTGKPPFSGSPLEVANQHTVQEPGAPDARRSSGGPDPDLDALILACLEKDPANRPSASEVTARLSGIASNSPKGGNRTRNPPKAVAGGSGGAVRGRTGGVERRRKPVLRTFAGAAALALVLVAGAAFAMMGDGGLQRPQVGSGAPEDRAAQDTQDAQSTQEGSAEQGAGDASQEEASQGDPSQGDPSQGDPSQGDPSQGDPSQGDPSQGDPSQGDAAPSDGALNVDGSAPPQGSADDTGEAPGSSEAAVQTVRDVYELAAAGDYESSYSLLSSGFRQREVGSVETWAGTFSTLESISFTEGPTASVSGDTSRVTGTTRAVHTDETEFNRGTWTLVRENGEWRLDSVSVQKL